MPQKARKAVEGAKALAPFGYLVNRLESTPSGKFVCAEDVICGTPLLALPLDACWTKKAVEVECSKIASALQACIKKFPFSALMQADATWIALHMVDELRQGAKGHPMRQAHLKTLPEKPASLLAWSENDLLSLEGSRWKCEAERCKKQMIEDFETLRLELGDVVGTDSSQYCWACSIIQQFGVQVMGENHSPFTVIAPGLNCLPTDDQVTPPCQGGVRLESTTLSSQPTLVLYALKDYSTGNDVSLLHGGLACSTGCRLMHCGMSLPDNGCESVELEIVLPVDLMPKQKDTVSSILEGLAALFTDGLCKALPGECMSPDLLNGELPVSIGERNGTTEIKFFVQFSAKQLLPGPRGLVTLGTVLAYNSSTQAQLELKEAGKANILGPVECQRRALEYLRGAINESFGDRRGEHAVVAAEIKILKSTLVEIESLLGSLDSVSVESPSLVGTVVDDLKAGGGEEPVKGSALEKTLQTLRSCAMACEGITATLQTKPAQSQGMSLMWELDVLRSSLCSCPLGDPMDMQSLPVLEGNTAVARAFKQTAVALLDASLEARQWECNICPKPTDSTKRTLAATAHVKVARLQMQKLKFQDALDSLKRSIQLSSGADAMKLAGECLISMAGPAQSVLDMNFDNVDNEQAFMLLRQKLKEVGYTKSGPHWSYPARLPVVMKFAGKTEMSGGPLADAFRLFMMHEVVPLGSMVELVGYKASRMLLSCGAVSCFDAASMQIIKPTDAAALANKRPEKPLNVFSNIMLWPLQEDLLVALDFDQLTADVQKFDPVPCLAQDSRVLMLSAPRDKASAVLDVSCGSGAQGLMALKNYASTAVFLDTNPRALRFVRFSVYLNGMGKRATFATGSLDNLLRESPGKTFDTVIMCPTCFPVPGTVSSNGGSTLANGGPDGQKMLETLLRKSIGLLSPGGRLVTTAMLPNPDSFAERLADWLENAGVRAVVLHGERITANKYENMASAGSSLPSAFAFSEGLKKEEVKSMSQGVVMLWKPTHHTPSSTIDLRSEHLGLWADDMFVASELQGALNQFQLMQSPGQQVYSMEWDDEDNEEEQPLALTTMMPIKIDPAEFDSCWSSMRKPVAVQNCRLASLIQPKVMKDTEFQVVDGATWKDLPTVNLFGYPLPCLMDQLWRKVEIPLGTHFPPNANAPEGETRIPRSNFGMAIVELEGCGAIPDIARDAVNSLDCYDQLCFEAGEGEQQKHLRKKHFGGWRKKVKDGEAPVNMLEKYDTFILAFGEQAGQDASTLPKAMREFLNYVSAWVEKKNVAIRVVVLTCGANGPTFPDGPPEEMLHRAAPLRGLFRCARQEVPELPILQLDTDEMGRSGDAETLADQISRELEAYTPENGLEDATAEEFSEAVYRTHREVAWRKGERFFPGLNPAARNPVNANINLDHLKLPAEGVVLITGGGGGLGVVTAQSLVELGVRCVVLASRSGRLQQNQGLEARVEQMEAMGAKVVLMGGCDTSKEDSVLTMLDNVRQLGQLKYVFHAAGVFSFDVEEVFAPKVNAAWWLHKYTLQDSLDAFVCYASMTECLGTAGMSSYAQANTYMEELCRYRHALGMCGTAIQFPEVMGVGMASSNKADAASIDNAIISQVMKIITADSAPIGPVISIMTVGFMMPRPPISYIYHEPLLQRVNAGLWQRLSNLESKIGRKKMNQLRLARDEKVTTLQAVTDVAVEGQE